MDITKQPRLRKSRSGCTSCRTRRVKCDEKRPVCGNCSKRFIDSQPCDYLEAPPRRITKTRKHGNNLESYTSNAVGNPTRRSLAYGPTSMQSSDQYRSLELRLMYHYTTVVSHTMPDCNGELAKDMWQRIVPQVAFDSEVVLNPMLAISALHLHAHSPRDLPMSLALARYLDRTLTVQREAVRKYDWELTQEVWLSAVILANINWLLAHQARPKVAYELPLQAWNMMHGVSSLFIRKYALLRNMGYSWYGHIKEPPIIPVHELPVEARKQMKALEDDLSELTGRFNIQACTEDERAAYSEARTYIISHYQAYFSGAETRILRVFIGTMPAKTRPTYLKLLESHDPLAMALLARLLVLLVPLESVWWMDGVGDYEVVHRDIEGICNLMPDHLCWCMEWPRRVLSGEIVLSR